MLAALASGKPGPASVLLGLGAWALFFAAEPVQVLLGRRGARARAEEGPTAAGRLLLLAGAAAVLGAAGFVAGTPAVRWALLVPALPAAAFVALLWAGQERTAAGEVLAAVTLSSMAFPIAVGALVGAVESGRALAVWALGLSALVFPVRAIGARRRAHTGAAGRVLPAVAVSAVAVGLVGVFLVPADVVALAPLVVASLWLGAVPPEPRQLRRVGWSLVGATLLTAGLLVLEVRGGLSKALGEHGRPVPRGRPVAASVEARGVGWPPPGRSASLGPDGEGSPPRRWRPRCDAESRVG